MQLTDTSALNPPIASSHDEIAFPENGFASVEIRRDYAGIDRMIMAALA